MLSVIPILFCLRWHLMKSEVRSQPTPNPSLEGSRGEWPFAPTEVIFVAGILSNPPKIFRLKRHGCVAQSCLIIMKFTNFSTYAKALHIVD
ncbi:hypothetical protein [Okeania sp. KiyG1]|uniref:hypothetical protein n=1 Tax=Okeania sp. KiyG1 TaxID=2720165 RepID=UPI001923A488|nr:hypothetical protein [Okeania sp. KiyG1]